MELHPRRRGHPVIEQVDVFQQRAAALQGCDNLWPECVPELRESRYTIHYESADNDHPSLAHTGQEGELELRFATYGTTPT